MNKINGIEVIGDKFAYDGCHKIYILEDTEDIKQATEIGYEILPIQKIEINYKLSCDLRFINNWKLDKTYVSQFYEEEHGEVKFEIN